MFHYVVTAIVAAFLGILGSLTINWLYTIMWTSEPIMCCLLIGWCVIQIITTALIMGAYGQHEIDEWSKKNKRP